jgi:hypothetical protein
MTEPDVTATPTALNDPLTVLTNLSFRTIRDRLADLDEQSRALRVLLRAAIARERAAARRHTVSAGRRKGADA